VKNRCGKLVQGRCLSRAISPERKVMISLAQPLGGEACGEIILRYEVSWSASTALSAWVIRGGG